MFETILSERVEHVDFEWPSDKKIKEITAIKQLKLKEIRYAQDKDSLLTGIKFVTHEFASPFFTPSKDKKGPLSGTIQTGSFYD